MTTAALYMPEAQDLDVLDVHPKQELQDCNDLLGDFESLQRFYDDNGYLLLRAVLDPESVARARDTMLAVAVRHGLVEPGDKQGIWTGKPFAGGMEESAEFSGISQRMFEDPRNQQLMAKVLGEKACMVPIVQYRLYQPGGPVTVVHQDGFYSPGIQDYKPVWVPLTPCPREVGGLMVAVGQNKKGYFHNLAKPSPFPVPKGVIDEDSWATTDYMPGDVLLVHPYSPHASMPNTSNRLRITFDTRVQSAARPSAVAATVLSVTPTSITVDAQAYGQRTYRVDEETFVRVLHPGVREPFARFAEVTTPGMRLVVVSEGDRAVMLRKAAEG
jgi:ectoine hydroxylase-related dioxygenase (phytanoyl-CoA dioxygenase family)